MTKNIKIKKWRIWFIAAIIVFLSVMLIYKTGKEDKDDPYQMIEQEISPQMGNIQVTVSTFGSVKPQNRLELKPSIDGRIEEILVDEGDRVAKGDILVWMSSTERASALDVARSQGEEAVKYWEGVYKPAPLIAPINAVVIVRPVEPGQSVSSSDVILVLSDRLIVEALADETDIGQIRAGNRVTMQLDAYPLKEFNGVVGHISHESTEENNVTMYKVDVVPDKVPTFLRSGMSATVDITVESKENALIVPLEAVGEEEGESFVLVKKSAGAKQEKRQVELGIADEENVEILSGINSQDKIIIKTQKFKLPQQKEHKGFLSPSWRKKKR